jgi:hypothetical protein
MASQPPLYHQKPAAAAAKSARSLHKIMPAQCTT